MEGFLPKTTGSPKCKKEIATQKGSFEFFMKFKGQMDKFQKKATIAEEESSCHDSSSEVLSDLSYHSIEIDNINTKEEIEEAQEECDHQITRAIKRYLKLLQTNEREMRIESKQGNGSSSDASHDEESHDENGDEYSSEYSLSGKSKKHKEQQARKVSIDKTVQILHQIVAEYI